MHIDLSVGRKRGSCSCKLLFAAAHQGNPRPIRRQRQRTGKTDAAAASGHECVLSIQAHAHL